MNSKSEGIDIHFDLHPALSALRHEPCKPCSVGFMAQIPARCGPHLPPAARTGSISTPQKDSVPFSSEKKEMMRA
jgi:hypothetical protein